MVETFDKDAKTTDSPEFLKKVEEVERSEKRIQAHVANVKAFIESSAEIVVTNKIMIESMYQLYAQTPYER